MQKQFSYQAGEKTKPPGKWLTMYCVIRIYGGKYKISRTALFTMIHANLWKEGGQFFQAKVWLYGHWAIVYALLYKKITALC
jgi:hypothetical protein